MLAKVNLNLKIAGNEQKDILVLAHVKLYIAPILRIRYTPFKNKVSEKGFCCDTVP